jgi:histidinol phosphatase-like enzyme
MNKTTFIFDIDGTICDFIKEDHKNYYIDNLIPNKCMIRKINQLYTKGHEIIFMTGRGAITGMDWTEETKKQLKVWGVKYHELRFAIKPLDYVYVDDKACSPKEFMEMY